MSAFTYQRQGHTTFSARVCEMLNITHEGYVDNMSRLGIDNVNVDENRMFMMLHTLSAQLNIVATSPRPSAIRLAMYYRRYRASVFRLRYPISARSEFNWHVSELLYTLVNTEFSHRVEMNVIVAHRVHQLLHADYNVVGALALLRCFSILELGHWLLPRSDDRSLPAQLIAVELVRLYDARGHRADDVRHSVPMMLHRVGQYEPF